MTQEYTLHINDIEYPVAADTSRNLLSVIRAVTARMDASALLSKRDARLLRFAAESGVMQIRTIRPLGASTPEPGTLPLVAGGLLGLAHRARRKAAVARSSS